MAQKKSSKDAKKAALKSLKRRELSKEELGKVRGGLTSISSIGTVSPRGTQLD